MFEEDGINSQMSNAFGYSEVQNIPSVEENRVTFEEPSKGKKKKRPGRFKKACAYLLSAVVLGAVAGSVMFSVNYVANKYIGKKTEKTAEDVSIATVSNNITQVSSVASQIDSDTSLVTQGSINVQAVAAAALPAMVQIKGTTTVSSSTYFGYGQSYQASTSGTGIIVGKSDTELLIVTNAHVVEDVDNLKCVFVDDATISCTVKGSKSDSDIAVVAVNLSDISAETAEKIAIAELVASDDYVVGQPVVAIGNALGEGQSVTTGIISATNRSITVDNTTFKGLILTDAAINSGNSGGALLNAAGKVIAINFAKSGASGVEGMAYSIPVSNVSELINSLMSKQTRTKVDSSEQAYLGIGAVDITSTYASYYGYPVGILVRTVADGSAASKAGLVSYDIIVGFDDQSITTMSALTDLLQYYKAGEKVNIEYYHLEGNEYKLKTVEVTLGKKS